MIEQANSTLDQIKEKVRRLVMEGDPSVLPDSEIERQINTFVEQDFPFDLRLNNFIERRSFYTRKGIDTYAVDMNEIRQPSGLAIASGYQMDWMQDYSAFNRLWPKIFTSKTQSADGSAGPYNYTASNIPLLRNEVVISATLSSGDAEVLRDNGDGDIIDDSDSSIVGSVNYTTGALEYTFSNTVDSGEDITIQFVPITLRKPNTIFFRNETFILRPVPDGVYKIEYDAFIVPTAFIANNQTPQINQWWQYFAYGAAKKILEERQDVESLNAIMPSMLKQEAMIINQTAAQNNEMRSASIYYNGQLNHGGGYLDGL